MSEQVNKSLVDLENDLNDLFEETMSPYRMTNIICSLGFTLRPQMTYQYCNKGYIKASKNSLGKWFVTKDDAIEWTIKYMKRQGA